jgi:hypothetical protein
MGRWNFDGFGKFEALVASNVDRFRAMLPRLVAIEKQVKQGDGEE